MKYWAFTIILFLGLAEFGYGAWIPAKAWLSQILLEQAWAETQQQKSAQKPWPWADTWPVLRLEHSRSQTQLLVMAGDSGQSLAFGPGHMSDSHLPGKTGNTVISGHRDTHFSFLKMVKMGDIITVTRMDGKSYRYRVFSGDVIDSQNQKITDSDEDRLTLVTCYPFDSITAGGPMRYIVSAELIPR